MSKDQEPPRRRRDLFEEVQTRYRSNPYSGQGGRFGYVDFGQQDRPQLSYVEKLAAEEQAQARFARSLDAAINANSVKNDPELERMRARDTATDKAYEQLHEGVEVTVRGIEELLTYMENNEPRTNR